MIATRIHAEFYRSNPLESAHTRVQLPSLRREIENRKGVASRPILCPARPIDQGYGLVGRVIDEAASGLLPGLTVPQSKDRGAGAALKATVDLTFKSIRCLRWSGKPSRQNLDRPQHHAFQAIRSPPLHSRLTHCGSTTIAEVGGWMTISNDCGPGSWRHRLQILSTCLPFAEVSDPASRPTGASTKLSSPA
jgi:hypothetical protein